jgi:peroxiredoxin Q/BCP
MKKIRPSALWFAAGAALVVLLQCISPARADEPAVGDSAPLFTLKGSDGKSYTLEAFRGKQAVVVAWFPKAFTNGCTIECKSFKEQSATLKGLGVAYFTASVDDPETNAKFAESLGLDYPILSDPEKTTAKAYGVLPEGRQAAVRWTFYIDQDGVIKHIDKMVKPQTAAEDLKATVERLGLAKK